MSLIQDNPRFKKDKIRYSTAIRLIQDETLRKEANSLYEQFLITVKQLDQSFELLISEGLSNSTQNTNLHQQLQSLRAQLEKRIAK
jgi:hypothetical protein